MEYRNTHLITTIHSLIHTHRRMEYITEQRMTEFAKSEEMNLDEKSIAIASTADESQNLKLVTKPRLSREERKMLREEKREARSLMKQERIVLKSEKKKIREQKKQERKAIREQKKLDRQNKPKKLAFEGYSEVDQLDWTTISHFYVDGNNLLFLTDYLRKLSLHNSKKQAERLLAIVTKDFAESQHIDSTIVFDATKIPHFEQEQNGITFRLCRARPTFATSDDQLVSWAQESDVSDVMTMVVVTSDRELCRRLHQLGCRLVKPKSWINFAANTLGKTEGQDLNDWLQQKQVEYRTEF